MGDIYEVATSSKIYEDIREMLEDLRRHTRNVWIRDKTMIIESQLRKNKQPILVFAADAYITEHSRHQ